MPLRRARPLVAIRTLDAFAPYAAQYAAGEAWEEHPCIGREIYGPLISEYFGNRGIDII